MEPQHRAVLPRPSRCSPLGILLTCLSLTLWGCSGGGGGGGDGDVGTSSPPITTISGLAQKGPFSPGAELTLRPLRADGRSEDDRQTQSRSSGEDGGFDTRLDWRGPTLIQVTGDYLDEVSGTLRHQRTPLQALVDIEQGDRVESNINLFTHLVAVRARALMKEGQRFREAVDRAEAELAHALDLESVPEGTPGTLALIKAQVS